MAVQTDLADVDRSSVRIVAGAAPKFSAHTGTHALRELLHMTHDFQLFAWPVKNEHREHVFEWPARSEVAESRAGIQDANPAG